MSTLNAGEDKQSISALSRPSRISYEVHHSLFFEELIKQTGSDSDEESQEEEPLACYLKNSDNDLLSGEIGAKTETVNSKGFIPPISSDAYLSSVNKDEEMQPNSDSARLPRSKVSVLAMLEKRIIDKAVKEEKIFRTRSVDVHSDRNSSNCNIGSDFSFKRASSLAKPSVMMPN